MEHDERLQRSQAAEKAKPVMQPEPQTIISETVKEEEEPLPDDGEPKAKGWTKIITRLSNLLKPEEIE